ncbi:MAG: NAD(P)-dependent alcohol dehydrogenase [Candidatus Nanopelagicales bacterium]
MRAAVNTSYGPPSVVCVREVAKPKAGPGDVIVKVKVATVNRTDCGFRAAKPFIVRGFSGLLKPKHTILGAEFAGVVDSIGSAVKNFSVGDRVFGYSEFKFGAHAEYLRMRADSSIAVIPDNLTFEQAAPSTEAAHYALACIRKAGVEEGQDVLVYGATGAIGTAAVQLLKSVGATVTAVCDAQTMDMVRDLGADRVIDRFTEDFTKDTSRYDVVFDAVGKSSFGKTRHLLRPKGLYVTTDLGAGAQNPLLSLVTPLFGRKEAMLPLPPKFTQALMATFQELTASGEFMPVIDRSYSLDQIVEAYEYVEEGNKVGNVLITVER